MKDHLNREHLERYLDNELSSEARTETDAHLATCPRCRREVESYASLFQALDTLPVPEVPRGFQVRILDAVIPRPTETQLLLRLATRAYVALAVVLTAVAATVLGVVGPGPVAGTLTSGLSRTLGDAQESLRLLVGGTANIFKALGEFIPVAEAAAALARGLETAAISLAPQHHLMIALTLVLATLVLIWAMSPARERGVPHVSLSF